jgi:RNA polymerase sigma-70 factor (ECF subfamily)
LEENQFIALLKNGDSAAYTRLVSLYSDRVYNTALGLLQNVEDAEDIAQEAFVQIFQGIANFKGESALSTWIYKITVTKSLELIRKRQAKKRFAIFDTLFGVENTAVSKNIPFYHPGVQLENKERGAILFEAINQLPEKQKTAFVLAKTEDLSYAEIAMVMELSVASVESLLFRAKQNLQKLLGDYYEKNEKN